MADNQPRLLDLHVLGMLSRDGRLLFTARILRLFAYGLISVVLYLYLKALGYSDLQAGLLLTLTLAGDAVVSLPITMVADRVGRRWMLMFGALLMLGAGAVFVCTDNFAFLLVAATIGVISPSGNEVGPFLAIEQAALSQLVSKDNRTATFAWYNLFGSLATALGALVAGVATHALQTHGFTVVRSYQAVLMGYALLGGVMLLLFSAVSQGIETPRTEGAKAARFGLHRSRKTVLGLSALFSMDAFGGGFIVQSIMAGWFSVRFGADVATIGGVFFGANILAGISALTASRIAKRFGLINTMVFTHIPSNVLLILVPLMPNLQSAIIVLLARFSISQMDVPTRQSFTMAVVDPDERSAAAGVTGIARTLGASASPVLAAKLIAIPACVSFPFFISGGIKIAYDLILWRAFHRVSESREESKIQAETVKV